MIDDFEKIGLLGNGGQADEAQSYVSEGSVVFRAVDAEYLDNVAQVDIANPDQALSKIPVVGAVGAPAIRRELILKWPGNVYADIISRNAVVDKAIKFLGGCIVAPGAILTTNIEIGKHTIINVASTIGHNTKIGEFVTISPGANIAGNVHLGDGVFIGIGATISNDVKIAPGVVVGAGAVVVKDIVEENAVYVGVPAKKIKLNEGWLREI